ncbi:MAG: 2-dehydro-3-deoxygluconokinase/2-dehydro-3-deoxygalactonokinase [Candidatus Woesearchaeota archaeon]|nr:2-dehydro-3-deoxygluconokinase/2-dehydro-3-deoxygalactonokinase [Candidatus Woesearchaeota archaeon]
MTHKFFGFCNPMVEEVLRVDENFIDKFNLKKGASNLVDLETYNGIGQSLRMLRLRITDYLAGGSGSNIMAGLSSLGYNTEFFGGVGDDEHGHFLEREMLDDYGVEPNLVRVPGKSCSIYTLVTPDGERTFATNLAAAQKVKPEDVNLEDILWSDFVFITGYKVADSPETSDRVIQYARENGKKIILDLSCGEHIEHARDKFESILKQGVYMLFANEVETQVLMGLKPGASLDCYEGIVAHYLKFADVVAQKLGPRGAIVGANQDILYENTRPVDIVNLNGAGDGFAIGFIHGYLQDGLKAGAILGNKCASKVITQVGPRRHFNATELNGYKD